MQVVIIPVLQDNYTYLLVDDHTKECAAVDPVEPRKVIALLEENQYQLTTILTTHSHYDHAGGNNELVQLMKQRNQPIQVVGGKGDNAQGCTREVDDHDEIQIGQLTVKVLYAPCHTPGHVLYLCEDALFSGDTLFIAGCGNFNSGTPEQMHYNLNTLVAKLPTATRVFCGHEYTARNLQFAIDVEPENPDIQKKFAWAKSQQCTIPSTVQEELATNPFMRVTVPIVQAYTKESEPVKVMAALRRMKSSFRYY